MPHPWKSFLEWIADEEKIENVLRVKVPIKCGDPNSIVYVVPAYVREENIRVNNCPGVYEPRSYPANWEREAIKLMKEKIVGKK